jgi:hypothetical protein
MSSQRILAPVIALLIVALIFMLTFGKLLKEPLPNVAQTIVNLPRKKDEETPEETPAHAGMKVRRISDYLENYKHPREMQLKALYNVHPTWHYVGRSEAIEQKWIQAPDGTWETREMGKSTLGNPYYANSVPGSTLKAYKTHLFKAIREQKTEAQRAILWELENLDPNAVLMCHCKNASTCHGSVIIAAYNWLHSDAGEAYKYGKTRPAPKPTRKTKKQKYTLAQVKANHVTKQAERETVKRTKKQPFKAEDACYYVTGKERLLMRIVEIRYKRPPAPIGNQEYERDPIERGQIAYDFVDPNNGQVCQAHRNEITYVHLLNSSTKHEFVWSDSMTYGHLEMHKPRSVHRPAPGARSEETKTAPFVADQGKPAPNWDKLEAAAQGNQSIQDAAFMGELHEEAPEKEPIQAYHPDPNEGEMTDHDYGDNPYYNPTTWAAHTAAKYD